MHTFLLLLFFYFGTGNISSPGEGYRKQFTWHGTQPGPISANDKCVGSNLYCPAYLWLLRDRRQRERELKDLSLSYLLSFASFQSSHAISALLEKEQKAPAVLCESRHAASPQGAKHWPPRHRGSDIDVSSRAARAAFITWHTWAKRTDLHLTHAPFVIIKGNWPWYWMKRLNEWKELSLIARCWWVLDFDW